MSKNGTIAVALAIPVLLGAIFLGWQMDGAFFNAAGQWMEAFHAFLESEIHPVLFVVLMAVLPVVGFPFSVFLVLAGVKFGAVGGMLVTVALLPVHMSLCFVLARWWVRRPLLRLLERRGYRPWLMHVDRPRWFLVVFLLLPGPPYILKTYMLALTGLPFRYFLPLNFVTESVVTLPIAALGGAAAQEHWGIFGGVLFVFVGVSLGLRWWKRLRAKRRKI